VLVAVSGLSVFALQSRYQALRAAEDSMNAAGTMALQASALPSGDANAGEVRGLIINQGCDLIDKFRRDAVANPSVRHIVLCRLERARHRENLEEHPEAGKLYAEAIDFARSDHDRLQRTEAALELLRAQQAYGEYLVRRKDYAGAETQFGRLRDESRRLAAEHQSSSEIARSEAEGLGRLGDLLAYRNERAKAVESYLAAAELVSQKLIAKEGSGEKLEQRHVAWAARLHRLSGGQLLETDAEKAIEQYRKSLEVASVIKSGEAQGILEIEIALTDERLFSAQSARREFDAARSAKAHGLASVSRIQNSRASDALKRRALAVKESIEKRKIPD
jgi:tetratricopeptide (TPR) repeat protein